MALWCRVSQCRAAARIPSHAGTWPCFVVSLDGRMLCFFLQHPSLLACSCAMSTSCCLIFQLCAGRIHGACSFWTACALIFMYFLATSDSRYWRPYACTTFCPTHETSLLRLMLKTLTLSQAHSFLSYRRNSHALSLLVLATWVVNLMILLWTDT